MNKLRSLCEEDFICIEHQNSDGNPMNLANPESNEHQLKSAQTKGQASFNNLPGNFGPPGSSGANKFFNMNQFRKSSMIPKDYESSLNQLYDNVTDKSIPLQFVEKSVNHKEAFSPRESLTKFPVNALASAQKNPEFSAQKDRRSAAQLMNNAKMIEYKRFGKTFENYHSNKMPLIDNPKDLRKRNLGASAKNPSQVEGISRVDHQSNCSDGNIGAKFAGFPESDRKGSGIAYEDPSPVIGPRDRLGSNSSLNRIDQARFGSKEKMEENNQRGYFTGNNSKPAMVSAINPKNEGDNNYGTSAAKFNALNPNNFLYNYEGYSEESDLIESMNYIQRQDYIRNLKPNNKFIRSQSEQFFCKNKIQYSSTQKNWGHLNHDKGNMGLTSMDQPTPVAPANFHYYANSHSHNKKYSNN